MAKVLIIRFSSIGDIVLTTPVIRSLKQQLPEAEVHYVTKPAYVPLLAENPYIDTLHELADDWQEMVRVLRQEQFDWVIDLHQNLRSWRLSVALRRPTLGIQKKNLAKWLLVQTKQARIPIGHIVTRYGAPLRALGISLDEQGLDMFVASEHRANAEAIWAATPSKPRLAVILGAKHQTKRWLPAYFVETLNAHQQSVLLLGGPDAQAEAEFICERLHIPYVDAVGKYDLMTSVALLDKVEQVLAHDTGFMHIASALQKQLFVLWGSTVPALGFAPYKAEHTALARTDVSCRPCDKIGKASCPKGHFRCMRDLSPSQVLSAIQDS